MRDTMPTKKRLIHSEAVCLDCPTAFGFEDDLSRSEVEDRAAMHRATNPGHRVPVYDGIGHLKDSLKGAKIVSWDRSNDVIFAWFGGHGIHAYAPNGDELNLWNVGDFSKVEPSRPEVWKAVERLESEYARL